MEEIDKMTMQEIFDRPIAYYPNFVYFAGVTGAVLFSQALYWSKRTTIEGGWFYKSREDWWLETGLTRREQETARRKLKKHKLLDEELRGNPATLFYRVNYDTLWKLIKDARKHT